jgi:hypothetical protein
MSMLARVPRSRATKDVDLAALRASDLAEAGRALTALVEADLADHLTLRLIRSTPTDHFDVPAEWTRTYPATAKGVPAAESFSARTAAGLVASFIDPALGKSTNPAAWDPYALAWIPDVDSRRERPADA